MDMTSQWFYSFSMSLSAIQLTALNVHMLAIIITIINCNKKYNNKRKFPLYLINVIDEKVQ